MLSGITRFVARTRGSLPPEMVTLELSAQCNLRCRMCTVWKGEWDKGMMPLSTLENLAPQLSRIPVIELNCRGEPLLNSDFPEMLRLLRRHCPKTHILFVTNGTIMTPQISESIVANALDGILISLDAADNGALEAIRVGARLEDILENVSYLLDTRRAMGARRPEISVVFTLMTINAHELAHVVNLCADLGIQRVCVNGLTPFSKEADQFKMWDYDQEWPGLTDQMRRCARQACSRGVEMVFPEFQARRVRSCDVSNPAILWNGRVAPCFMLCDERQMVINDKEITFPEVSFGNVNGQSLEEVWNSQLFRRFRHARALGILPGFCRHCTRASKVLCPDRHLT